MKNKGTEKRLGKDIVRTPRYILPAAEGGDLNAIASYGISLLKRYQDCDKRTATKEFWKNQWRLYAEMQLRIRKIIDDMEAMKEKERV